MCTDKICEIKIKNCRKFDVQIYSLQKLQKVIGDHLFDKAQKRKLAIATIKAIRD